ncbi:MAG: hypothetical protein B7Z26_06005 [Asticcacaulis sp. 32-58-5]|nr:MAG: hypothetical protein B7Z26_06005 [Asticcacaulis sp. 32-58-5]
MNTADVFINCPFSRDYDTHFKAIVFVVIRSGFTPRCAREDDDVGDIRYEKICRIIAECKFGVHDISYTGLYDGPAGDPDFPLPRFNMPLELGLFLGAKKFGGDVQAKKKIVVFDRDEHRFRKFISDISGSDIKAHNNNTSDLITTLATWLRHVSQRRTVPGPAAMLAEYQSFTEVLPILCASQKLLPEEVEYQDYVWMVSEWMRQRAQ